MKNIIVIMLALVGLYGCEAWGQNVAKLDLPPIPNLEVLIDSAVARSPMRSYQIERQQEAKQLVKSARWEWTEYLGAESYYRYGQLGAIENGGTQGGAPTIPIVTSSHQSQSWWYVGAYIRLPLFSMVNRGTEIKRLRHTVRQAEYLQADAADAISREVIDLYNEVKLNIEILQIKANLLVTNNAQLIESEIKYKNQKIDLGRLAQLQEMQAKVAVEFATAQYTARASLTKLQLITGMQLLGTTTLNIDKDDVTN